MNLGCHVLLELRMMEVVVTTGTIRCAKLQSNRHHQQTNTQLRMPFLSPNQQCQSTEGRISHSKDLLTEAHLSLPTLSLTTKHSWLPWGGVAMPLVSRLMPVPHGKNWTQDEKPWWQLCRPCMHRHHHRPSSDWWSTLISHTYCPRNQHRPASWSNIKINIHT